MEPMQAGYTALEQELLDLFEDIRARLRTDMAHDPDAAAMWEELQDLEDLVNARRTLRAMYDDPEVEGAMTHDICPTCQVGRDLGREIVGDREQVVCTICTTVLVEMPRSRKAQLARLDLFLEKAIAARDDGTLLAKGLSQDVVTTGIQQAQTLRTRFLEEQREREALVRAGDTRLELIRDQMRLVMLTDTDPKTGGAQG